MELGLTSPTLPLFLQQNLFNFFSMELEQLWNEVSPHPTSSLIQATEQYHHAIQYISMLGKSFLQEQADDSQTNLEWWPDRDCFAGRRIPAKPALRLILDTRQFSLVFFRDARHPAEFLSLQGLKKEEVQEWVEGIVKRKGLDVEKVSPSDHYQIPTYPLEQGEPYTKPSESAQHVLAAYRSNADLILSRIAGKFPKSGSVRIWPHHFDTGIYIPMVHNSQKEVTQALGVGMAIPDEHIADYYFYVTPYNNGKDYSDEELPALEGGGIWKKKAWVGAVLPLTQVADNPSAAQQVEQVQVFFQHAIRSSLSLLDLSSEFSL